MVNYDDVQELCKKLEEYADLEGTEAGEFWIKLSSLNINYYMMSEEFYQQYYEELKRQLEDIETNYEVIEEEVEIPGYIKKYKELRYREE